MTAILRSRRRSTLLSAVFGAALWWGGCASDSPGEPPDHSPAAIEIVAGNGQEAVVAMSTNVSPRVRVTDAAGAGVAGIAVTFSASVGWITDAVVTTDVAGEASTTWYLGPVPGSQTLTATAAGHAASFTAIAAPLVEGTRYLGTAQFVEFVPGDLPVIVSAPHGGTLTPASFPDRTGVSAVNTRDLDTDKLAFAVESALLTKTGGSPHVVVLHLHRSKLDANREINEAAEGHRAAERTWREYHGFIDAAREHVIAKHGRGLVLDLHGHGHELQRIELGYLLTTAQLAGDDDALNSPSIVQRSSIRTLAGEGGHTHAQLLRGTASLGTLLEMEGYPTVPSSSQPDAGAHPYFTGGYSTQRHGSRDGGPIDGVQIEANRIGVRDSESNLRDFAAALARAVNAYFAAHYGGVGVGAAH